MKNQKFFLLVSFLVVLVLVIYLINNASSPDGRDRPAPEGGEGNGLPGIAQKDPEIRESAESRKSSETEKALTDKEPSIIASEDKNKGHSLAADEEKPSAPFQVTNSRAVTPKGNFIHPRWSPDGMDILCTKDKFKGLYLVSLDGSEIRELSDAFGVGYKVKWSADGTKLIVESDGKTKVFDITGEEITDSPESLDVIEDAVYARDDNIYLKNLETGEEMTLTDGEDAFFDPDLSPDGEKVAYQGLTTGIHVKDLSTGEVIDIGQGTDMQWTPDGNGLIYSYTQDDGMNIIAGDIYFAYADGSGYYNVTNTPDIIELNPTISPDGKQVTYEVDGQVFVADLE